MDSWNEIAFIAISDDAGNEYEFAAITRNIDIKIGNKGIVTDPLINSGLFTRFKAEDTSEIAMDLIPLGIKSSGTIPNGVHAWFLGRSPTSTSAIDNYKRYKFRVCILWTTYVGSISTSQLIPSADNSMRISFWGAYLSSAELKHDNEMLISSVVFSCPPYDENGHGMIKAEEATSATLSTLGAYSGNYPT